jgi:hypothetical protein
LRNGRRAGRAQKEPPAPSLQGAGGLCLLAVLFASVFAYVL